MKELNEKLAKFAGFETLAEKEWFQPDRKYLRYVYPTGQKKSLLPNFTSSLNACFKWLVPKVVTTIRWVELKSGNLGYEAKIVRLEMYVEPQVEYEDFDKDSPALALCKAIEQLIDKEQS